MGSKSFIHEWTRMGKEKFDREIGEIGGTRLGAEDGVELGGEGEEAGMRGAD